MASSENNVRVVITGTGAITPLGHNVADTWRAILDGESGISEVRLGDGRKHITGGLCNVKSFQPEVVLGKKKARRRDRHQQLATVAAREAMSQSGLEVNDANRELIGICFGTGVGGIITLVEQEHIVLQKGVRWLSPFGITKIMPNGAAGMLAIDYGIHGPSPTIATACAAGSDAIGHAFRMIKSGALDAVLTGGAESVMTSVAVGGFERAGATSIRSSGTPSPFDLDRDGLIVGEGAGMMVLESLQHAMGRGAEILGELVGYGQTTDAYHITAPAEGGAGAARAMKQALAEARMNPDNVDYISAHGTGTQLNDRHETQAIKTALGAAAYDVAISSTKSMTGHIMGATGAIESIFALNAMRDNVLPPTINYRTPDPDCDLDYVPNHPREAKVSVVVNNAFGFGGHNAVLVFKEFSG